MLEWLTGSKNSNTIKLVDSSGIGILSASCCNPAAFGTDEALVKNLKEALAGEGLSPPIHFETISAAQAGIMSLVGKLNPEQTATLNQVMGLFGARGIGAFPVLIIGGKVATYGEAPSVETLREKLRTMPIAKAPPAGASAA